MARKIRQALVFPAPLALAAFVAGSFAEKVTADGTAAPDRTARLVYRSPSGVTFVVTADGLSSVRFRDREVARGGWSPFNAEPWFKDAGGGKVNAEKLADQSIRVLDDHRARVRHVRGDLICMTDYDFAGEDLTISARGPRTRTASGSATGGSTGPKGSGRSARPSRRRSSRGTGRA